MQRDDFLVQLPQLVATYRPAPEVIAQIKDVSLLMIVGPSGSGKTTLIKSLNLPYVASDTTRSIRPGEVEGKDYYFITDYNKLVEDINNGLFLQVAIGPAGDFYGTKGVSYPASGVAVMAVVSDVVPVFRTLGFKSTVSAFVSPPSYIEWMKRLSAHVTDAGTLDRRLAEAYRSFSFALSDNQTHFILNEEVDKAVIQINELINSKVQSVRELTARAAAEEILSHLK